MMAGSRAGSTVSARLTAVALLATVAGACRPGDAADITSQPALAAAFDGAFRVGAAIGAAQITGTDSIGRALVAHHFNTISSTNAMKWERIHPGPGRYHFSLADRFVELGEAHGQWVVGHTLIWHQQTPAWVFRAGDGGPVSRDTLLARMRDHIHTVVGRYRGRVDGWDVVNEALAEDGSLRRSPWLEIIGEDYIAKAFEFAREADPDAELYYNDYSLTSPAKRAGAVELVTRLQDAGVPIDAVGLQGHYRLDSPSTEALDRSLRAFADLGVAVMVTELDVNVLPWPEEGDGAEVDTRFDWRPELDPYADGLPAAVQDSLARRYADLFEVFLDHSDHLERVTFWGTHDAASWLNDWPVRGRTNYPLLFDGTGAPKDAFRAVLAVAPSAPDSP